jgi:hypothetical protein
MSFHSLYFFIHINHVWSFIDSFFFCSITEIMFSLHCSICACKQPHLKSPTDILNPGDHLHPLKFSISTFPYSSIIFISPKKIKIKIKSQLQNISFFFFTFYITSIIFYYYYKKKTLQYKKHIKILSIQIFHFSIQILLVLYQINHFLLLFKNKNYLKNLYQHTHCFQYSD